MKVRYQKADVRGVGVSFVFIPMGQSPRQKIAPNVSRIKATIPMINNELKQLQSRRKILIENLSNFVDDIAEIDKELAGWRATRVRSGFMSMASSSSPLPRHPTGFNRSLVRSYDSSSLETIAVKVI